MAEEKNWHVVEPLCSWCHWCPDCHTLVIDREAALRDYKFSLPNNPGELYLWECVARVATNLDYDVREVRLVSPEQWAEMAPRGCCPHNYNGELPVVKRSELYV